MFRSFRMLVAGCLVTELAAASDVTLQALTNDDVCEERAPDRSCALNALQMRSQRLVSEDPIEASGSGEILCDPNCDAPVPHQAPMTDDLDVTLGSSAILHYAQDCWTGCNKTAGWCPEFCGEGNACCNHRDPSPPAECKNVDFFPILHAHTCVWPAAVPPPPDRCMTRATNYSENMTLYHQTSPQIGELILHGGFRTGKAGWCGGAVYFATTPQATVTKTSGIDSHKGFMLQVTVDVGRVKHMPSTCDMSMNGQKLHDMGYDTIRFNPVDGDEYVIYCSTQVLEAKHISWP